MNILILGSAITGFVSICAFSSLVGMPIGIMISGTGLKFCAITARITKYRSIIKKKKKKHNKIASLPKSKLNYIELLISTSLIDWVISHDEFVLMNNVLKEYEEMKKETKNLDFNRASKILFYL